MAESMRKKWQDDAHRAKVAESKSRSGAKERSSAAGKEHWDRPGTRAKAAETMRSRWADPEYHKKMIAVQNEGKQKARQGRKAEAQ